MACERTRRRAAWCSGALSQARPTEARAEIEHSRELAGDDYVSLQPRAVEALADLAEMHGRREACERQLREALRLYEQIGADGHARRLRDRLERPIIAS
jgi:hypothetical protein